ncbi:hypothetical protein MRB53_034618 [Persea americana]|uniref:Uncharacterized protein n=1 Tax=Persea americana TaxID=3435 RepID=A0ACC2K2E4_PERAE|nr:hypothetical protein MRB53_034618 [Persea americana]
MCSVLQKHVFAYPPVFPVGIDDLLPGPPARVFPTKFFPIPPLQIFTLDTWKNHMIIVLYLYGSMGGFGIGGGIGGGACLWAEHSLDFQDFREGVPPGSHFDPIGPPNVPGFEPERFIRSLS